MSLKQRYESICNDYLKAFCKKHDYDLGEWQSLGGTAYVGDLVVSFDDIMHDMDNHVLKPYYERYYDYCMQSYPDPMYNYENWLKFANKKEYRFGTLEAVKYVCEKLGVDYLAVLSTTREYPFIQIRHCFMYYWRKQGTKLADLGNLFGGKNHASAINAVNRIDSYVYTKDKEVLKILDLIREYYE